jgi:hypothetical protein
MKTFCQNGIVDQNQIIRTKEYFRGAKEIMGIDINTSHVLYIIYKKYILYDVFFYMTMLVALLCGMILLIVNVIRQ